MVGATLIADQASKSVVRMLLPVQESIAVIPGTFYITHVRNAGAAFGLLPGYRPVFMTTSLAVVVGVAAFWLWSRPKARWLVFSLGFVTAGALGNLIDRVATGLVTDFMDVTMWPVFNVADAAIVVGATMLVGWVLFGPEPAARTYAGPGAPNEDGTSQ